MKSPRSQRIVQNGLAQLRSPMKAPVPDRPTVRTGPDEALEPDFHAPNLDSRTTERRTRRPLSR